MQPTQQPFNFFNQPPVKLTTAQLWLVHVLGVTFIAASVAAGITVYGAIVSGNHDWQVIGGLALAAAIAVGAKAWSADIQNNANLMPAILDYAHNIMAFVSQAPTQIPIPVQPQGPLIVQHITQLPEPPIQSSVAPVHPLVGASTPVQPTQITLTPGHATQTAYAPSGSVSLFTLPQKPVGPQPSSQGWPPAVQPGVPVVMTPAAVPVEDVEPDYYVAPQATAPVEASSVPERSWNDSAVLKVVTPGP